MFNDTSAAKAEARLDRLRVSPKDVDTAEAVLERIESVVAAYQVSQSAFTELARELGDEEHGVGKECKRLHSVFQEVYNRLFVLPLLEAKSKPDGVWVDGKNETQPIQRDPEAAAALKQRLASLRDRAAKLNAVLNPPTAGGFNSAKTQFVFPAEI